MQSEKIGELAAALAKAQAEIAAPKKGRTAQIKSDKGSYSYSYADLADVIEAYRKPLATHGLALTQAMRLQDGHLVLNTKLLHLSDQWIDSDYPIQSYTRPQEQGSAITYARRYAVSALLGIAAEDDDDGAAAQGGTPKTTTAPAKPAEVPTVKASVLSREEIEAMHSLVKEKGMKTVTEFRAYLKNLTGQEQAKDLSKAEYVSVMDALKAMREKVPA